jgi:hypothetical protein
MKRLVKVSVLLGVLALAACSTGFDAKHQVAVLDSRVGPSQGGGADGRPDSPDDARTKLVAQAFAMVPVATDIDPFPHRPKLTLPPDSKLHYSVQIKAYGSGDRSMRYQTHGVAIQTPEPYERFDREIAPTVADAAALPAGTALLFEWTNNGGGTGAPAWDAVPVRLPVLATAHDIASVTPELHESRKLNPDGKTFRTSLSQAVHVSLTPEATTRLSRWGADKTESPIASAVKGRIMDVSALGSATAVYLELEWLPEEERKSAAEALAAELRSVAGK